MARLLLLSLVSLLLYPSCARRTGTSSPPLTPMPTETPLAPKYDAYEKEWAEIDSLERKGLFKSALTLVEQLYARAKAERNTPQIIKALLYRGKYTVHLEEDGFEKAVALFEKEESAAAEPERSVLQSLLGEFYHTYLQNRGWTIQERTPVVGEAEGELSTLSAEQIELRALQYYRASVANEDRLLQVPVQELRALLTPSQGDSVEGDPLRPTLFDLLAHRALEHFANERSYLTQPVYQFYLDQPEAFAPVEDFVRFDFVSQDTSSTVWLSLRLFQRVLAAHLSRGNTAALIDADLLRLRFVRNKSALEDKWERYADALQALHRQHYNHPSDPEIAYYLGAAYRELSERPQYAQSNFLQRAVAECESAIARQPDTYGAHLCRTLLDEIQRPAIQIQVEQVYLPEKPNLVLLSFKNIRQVWVRVVAIPHAMSPFERDFRIEEICSAPAIDQRLWALDAPEDFRQHSTELRLPPLAPGYYAVIASPDSSFDERKQPVAYALFACSQLAGVSYSFAAEKQLAVVHRETGVPLSRVKVDCFYREWDNTRREERFQLFRQLTTGPDGIVRLESAANKQLWVRLARGTDTLWLNTAFYLYPHEYDREELREVVFFTDRSLYRPGQTVYFKGVLIRRDAEGQPHILPGQKVQVTFFDANDQARQQLDLVSNEYGTFNGAFQAPTSGLMGSMSIRAEGYAGEARFSVEEYKRPKFEVVFRPVEGSYRVGDTVAVRGEARDYAGSSVGGAAVRYRVVRQNRMPIWWGWWRIWPPSPAQKVEIAQGTTTTAADGSFEIVFTALPDRAIPAGDLPTFEYTVMADVTDITGETRSNEAIVVARYTALNVEFGLSPEMEIEALRKIPLSTTNNAGQPQHAEGTISITRLVPPRVSFLKRYWSEPDVWTLSEEAFRHEFSHFAWKGEDRPERWDRQDFTRTIPFRSTGQMALDVHAGQMSAGYYEIVLETRDAFGKAIALRQVVRVWDVQKPETRFTVPATAPEATAYEPGDTARLWLGGGRQLHFLLIEGRAQGAQPPRWMIVDDARQIEWTVQESDRGGFAVNAFAVQHNRFYCSGPHRIEVPWSNKELHVTFETFRDRLAPGDRETWRLRISGPQKERVAAEVVASMYDASLDQFLPHRWSTISFPSHYYNLSVASDAFGAQPGTVRYRHTGVSLRARRYAVLSHFGFPLHLRVWLLEAAPQTMAVPRMKSLEEDSLPYPSLRNGADEQEAAASPAEGTIMEEKKSAAVTPAPIRRNLNETVFFMPALRTDAEGNVVLAFIMNEALTRWKLLLFAHTKDLKQTLVERTVVTQKELMVLPNPPRFVREGDVVELTAKVSNLSSDTLSGTATLSLFDAVTLAAVESLFGLNTNEMTVAFRVAPGQSTPLSWRLKVPEGQVSALTWQIFAESQRHRDGEENTLPVMSNRMLVTETLPMTVRSGQQKAFSFESLKDTPSSTLRPHRFTVEFSANPAWYAVQALPYLMEFPHECSEQIFSRFYANAIAAHVVQQLPNLRRVYERWRALGSPSMQSNLIKNQELKAALLEETPWVLDALGEEQQKRNIALLFDLNRMADEQERALQTLAERQAPNGGWSWFPGGRESWYITQHIVAGFGHLHRLGAIDLRQHADVGEMLDNALGFCHRQIREQYARLAAQVQEGKTRFEDDHLDGMAVHYLYATSFFPVDKVDRVAAYYLDQGARYWLQRSLYEQGMLALALHRHGRKETAQAIVASLRERAIVKEELGMYWAYDWGMYWYQLPIETQALLVEVFHEVANDARAVEELRIWLLKNKQTNRWESTKATAEAVYALLLRGDNWLANTQPVRLQLGAVAVAPTEYEPGTGYFKQEWKGAEIQPSWSTIRIDNPNQHLVWGAAYWQYFEQLDKISAFQKTPLTLVKQLYREENTPTGPKLYPLSDGAALRVGDRLRVRIEIRTDRAMEFVHLKDMRAAGFEPVHVLSQYHWQDGLGYYESTRDLATHFFIDYLPRGTFVLEYPVVVSHRGDFSSGVATLQCMYAPEFSSHSSGIRIAVR